MPEEVAVLLDQVEALAEVVATVEDPVARARVATEVLEVLEEVRLVMVEQRRRAAAASGLGPRGVARALGVSRWTACDLLSSAAGAKRREGR